LKGMMEMLAEFLGKKFIIPIRQETWTKKHEEKGAQNCASDLGDVDSGGNLTMSSEPPGTIFRFYFSENLCMDN
jgi:hypothetical protein